MSVVGVLEKTNTPDVLVHGGEIRPDNKCCINNKRGSQGFGVSLWAVAG